MTGCGASSQLSGLELFLMELLSFSKELLTLVLKLTKYKKTSNKLHVSSTQAPSTLHVFTLETANVSNVSCLHFAEQ